METEKIKLLFKQCILNKYLPFEIRKNAYNSLFKNAYDDYKFICYLRDNKKQDINSICIEELSTDLHYLFLLTQEDWKPINSFEMNYYFALNDQLGKTSSLIILQLNRMGFNNNNFHEKAIKIITDRTN